MSKKYRRIKVLFNCFLLSDRQTASLQLHIIIVVTVNSLRHYMPGAFFSQRRDVYYGT